MSGNFAPSRKTKTDEEDANFWSTRPETFQDAQRLHGRALKFDVCAEPLTAKCDDYYCLANGQDALILPWPDDWFCNPPFDRKLEFVERARYFQREIGHAGMFLLPFEPASGWWRKHMSEGLIVYVPDGRIGYMERDGKTRKSGVNFPSALVGFPTQFIGPSIQVPYNRSPTPKKERSILDEHFKKRRQRNKKTAQRAARNRHINSDG